MPTGMHIKIRGAFHAIVEGAPMCVRRVGHGKVRSTVTLILQWPKTKNKKKEPTNCDLRAVLRVQLHTPVLIVKNAFAPAITIPHFQS